MDSLSTRIAELNDLVTLAVNASPYTSASKPSASPFRSPAQTPVLPSNETLSPGSGPYAANSRAFVRAVSAPASAHILQRMDDPHPVDRQASRLRQPHTLMNSPTLTEMSEDGQEGPTASQIRYQGGSSSPSALSPRVNPDPRRGLGRSKTGVVIFSAGNERTEREVTVNAAQNCLTRWAHRLLILLCHADPLVCPALYSRLPI